MNPMLREELASIIAEAVASPPPLADLDFQAVDVSPRARKIRAILRIADSYGWRSAITHFLETRGQSHICDLSDPQLDDLMGRMEGFVDAAETGASLADCLPAS